MRMTLAALMLLSVTEAKAMDVQRLAANDLDSLRWQARPVVVIAEADDPRLGQQLQLLDAAAADLADRQMPVLLGSPAEGAAFLGGGDDFAVVLIGKDGGVKARYRQVVDPAALTGLVDTMPMRRGEVARAVPE